MPQDVNLTAYRHATWGGPSGAAQVVFVGEDLTDAAFAWSFADSPGGRVLLTLENAAEGVQGVSATYDPGYVHPTSGSELGATILLAQIDEATLEALPSSRVACELMLAHTLYATRADGFKQVQFAGSMVVMPGAPN